MKAETQKKKIHIYTSTESLGRALCRYCVYVLKDLECNCYKFLEESYGDYDIVILEPYLVRKNNQLDNYGIRILNGFSGQYKVFLVIYFYAAENQILDYNFCIKLPYCVGRISNKIEENLKREIKLDKNIIDKLSKAFPSHYSSHHHHKERRLR